MRSAPLISVCIPSYNAGRYVREAIESVLVQLPPRSEVIVADDGSADDTASIAESFGYPVRVMRLEHAGVGAAFNAAVASSSGSLITSIDADDRWTPGRIAVQLEALDADPTLDAVFGEVREFISPDVAPEDRNRWACSTSPRRWFSRSTMMLRREAWIRHGLFRADRTLGEFIEWYSRAIDTGLRAIALPQVVLERRIHGANTVLRMREHSADYLTAVIAHLHRLRAADRLAEER